MLLFYQVQSQKLPPSLTCSPSLLTAGSYLTHAHKRATHFYIRSSSGDWVVLAVNTSRHRPHTPLPTRFSGGDTKLAVAAEFYGAGAPAVSVKEATVGHVTATTTTTTLLTCHWREEGRGARVESLLLEPRRAVRESPQFESSAHCSIFILHLSSVGDWVEAETHGSRKSVPPRSSPFLPSSSPPTTLNT